MEIKVIIPAREGSKGLPGKNLKKLFISYSNEIIFNEVKSVILVLRKDWYYVIYIFLIHFL